MQRALRQPRPLIARATAALAFALCAGAQAQATYEQRFDVRCTPCHGERGVSGSAFTPSLAGQPAAYAFAQLSLFRDGRREPDSMMSAIAMGMSDEDLRGYARVIDRLPPLAAALPDPATTDAGRMARGAALAGRLRCARCHDGDQATFEGGPPLAGQREDYLLAALRAFRSATRVSHSQAMKEAALGTSDEDLIDLAHYFSRSLSRSLPRSAAER
jgi:cytochrome c553